MTEWTDVMLIALGSQLAVLPGEKVQFLIAGLSTRYNPYLVVAAAGSAFAGWTALEILFGSALQQVLPELYLDLLTVALFLLFAGMLYRSAPRDEGLDDAHAPDGHGVLGEGSTTLLGVSLPSSVTTFLGIFSMMAFGEVGDKTQLVTIGLAAQYGASSAIWVGEMIIILPVSLANALLFHRFAHRVDLRKAHYAGAGIFAFFAFDILLSVTTGTSPWGTAVQAVSEVLLAGV
ncbi:MAG: TMEM165/GDT1 family protein [Salinibacter sp.]